MAPCPRGAGGAFRAAGSASRRAPLATGAARGALPVLYWRRGRSASCAPRVRGRCAGWLFGLGSLARVARPLRR
eukprot:6376575-Alexandrium_andersonii.AAC.1